MNGHETNHGYSVPHSNDTHDIFKAIDSNVKVTEMLYSRGIAPDWHFAIEF